MHCRAVACGVLLAFLVAMEGCMTRVRHTAGHDANTYRLANNEYEVVVGPANGRIVRYGRIGGSNILWMNPKVRETETPFPGWKNWGGDKVWIWPEGDWQRWRGGPCAPPGDPMARSFEVKKEGRRLRMTSGVVPGYGVQIVREIMLAETGAQLTIVNQLKQVESAAMELPVAPWTVTQIPAPKEIYARLVNEPGANAMAFPPNPWAVTLEGKFVTMRRPENPWVKMGLDADKLGAIVDGMMFTVTTVSSPGETFEPCRRSQVFSDPDKSTFRPAGVGAYVELEFTGSPRRLKVGETATLTTIWNLHPLPRGRKEHVNARDLDGLR